MVRKACDKDIGQNLKDMLKPHYKRNPILREGVRNFYLFRIREHSPSTSSIYSAIIAAELTKTNKLSCYVFKFLYTIIMG